MRSSERGKLVLPVFALILASVTACSGPPTAFAPGVRQNASSEPAQSRAPGEFQPAGVSCISRAGAPDAKVVAELRKAVEGGPLFLALATRATWTACSVREESGKLVFDYEFSDGGRLHVERDARIEFTLQEVRFATAVTLDAREVLMRAERAAFGADGCGIDWSRGETQAVTREEELNEIVYRGDTCNCQARVRSDKANRVMGLLFRSAC